MKAVHQSTTSPKIRWPQPGPPTELHPSDHRDLSISKVAEQPLTTAKLRTQCTSLQHRRTSADRSHGLRRSSTQAITDTCARVQAVSQPWKACLLKLIFLLFSPTDSFRCSSCPRILLCFQKKNLPIFFSQKRGVCGSINPKLSRSKDVKLTFAISSSAISRSVAAYQGASKKPPWIFQKLRARAKGSAKKWGFFSLRSPPAVVLENWCY